ncbi:MAG: hypothetical protein K6T63_02685 [Alicyclobacillus herbarius]|uniref:hypothetical protein n=1 Tax=Alicyclobacillus herbarius TaxID=122960 RepID=UPI000402DE0A|nr:hypothetical protein [Alicyclobacillus herbarius]MCL6631514.1 hypothetical protein [Alicyclobacillus herbarius]
MVLTVVVAVLFILAAVCWFLRRKVMRGLFATLAILFFLAFFALLGYIIGYQAGMHGVHVLDVLI